MTDFFDLARVVAVILGGGQGTRLEPLTHFRAKGALPILANHRLIDVPLSNLINSGLKKILMTVQGNSQSLTDHTNAFADSATAPMSHDFIQPVNPNIKEGFFLSDAHSLSALDMIVWQHLNIADKYDYVVIMMSDQVLKIDLRPVIFGLTHEIDMVMVHTEVAKEEAANKLGVLTFGDEIKNDKGDNPIFKKVTALHEKLSDPPECRPGFCSANLQLLVMKISTLRQLLEQIRQYPPSTKLSEGALLDLIGNKEINTVGYDLNSCIIGGERHPEFFDIESPDTYYKFSMSMCNTVPRFNAHDKNWELYTTPRAAMASKIGNMEQFENIMLGYNVIVQDKCKFFHSVISRNSFVGNGSTVNNSVINDGCTIGPGCHIENAIIDKGVNLPAGTVVTADAKIEGLVKYDDFVAEVKKKSDIDAAPVITPNGVIVIPKGYKFN